MNTSHITRHTPFYLSKVAERLRKTQSFSNHLNQRPLFYICYYESWLRFFYFLKYWVWRREAIHLELHKHVLRVFGILLNWSECQFAHAVTYILARQSSWADRTWWATLSLKTYEIMWVCRCMLAHIKITYNTITLFLYVKYYFTTWNNINLPVHTL